MKKVLTMITLVLAVNVAQAKTTKAWENVLDESGRVVAIVLVERNDAGAVSQTKIPKLFKLIEKALGRDESNTLCETAYCGSPFMHGGGN